MVVLNIKVPHEAGVFVTALHVRGTEVKVNTLTLMYYQLELNARPKTIQVPTNAGDVARRAMQCLIEDVKNGSVAWQNATEHETWTKVAARYEAQNLQFDRPIAPPIAPVDRQVIIRTYRTEPFFRRRKKGPAVSVKMTIQTHKKLLKFGWESSTSTGWDSRIPVGRSLCTIHTSKTYRHCFQSFNHRWTLGYRCWMTKTSGDCRCETCMMRTRPSAVHCFWPG